MIGFIDIILYVVPISPHEPTHLAQRRGRSGRDRGNSGALLVLDLVSVRELAMNSRAARLEAKAESAPRVRDNGLVITIRGD